MLSSPLIGPRLTFDDDNDDDDVPSSLLSSSALATPTKLFTNTPTKTALQNHLPPFSRTLISASRRERDVREKERPKLNAKRKNRNPRQSISRIPVEIPPSKPNLNWKFVLFESNTVLIYYTLNVTQCTRI